MLGHSSENDWSGHDSLLLCSPGDEAPQAPCLARLLGVVEVVELRVTFHEVLDVVEVGGEVERGAAMMREGVVGGAQRMTWSAGRSLLPAPCR
jgi:hypothetical protein